MSARCKAGVALTSTFFGEAAFLPKEKAIVGDTRSCEAGIVGAANEVEASEWM